jgi:hypothetical protein
VTVVVAVAWSSGVRLHLTAYWVVAVGVTVTEPDTLAPVLSPAPKHERALAELHVSFVGAPGATTDGLACNCAETALACAGARALRIATMITRRINVLAPFNVITG